MLDNITEQELAENGVASAPDHLTGKAADNKKLFDKLIMAVIAPHLNRAIDALNKLERDMGAAEEELRQALRNHIEIDPSSVRDNNVSVTGARMEDYGLTELVNPTMADALDRLAPLMSCRDDLTKLSPAAKYMEHWWYRRRAASSYSYELSEVHEEYRMQADDIPQAYILHTGYGYASEPRDIVYSSEIRVDDEGLVRLVSPQTLTVSHDEVSAGADLSELLGKYVARASVSGYRYYGPLYIPVDATIAWQSYSQSSGKGNMVFPTLWQDVTPVVPEREWELLCSANREAHPDSGVVGGYEYYYAGPQVERTGFGARIFTGSYTGNGLYGAEHPVALVCPFRPQIVFIDAPAGVVLGDSKSHLTITGIRGDGVFEWGEDRVRLVSTTSLPTWNTLERKYNYFIIG